MKYIKGSNQRPLISVVYTLLFQLCVIADALIGFNPKLYVYSKGCMLCFFVVMIIYLVWTQDMHIGRMFLLPVLFMIITGLSCLWADYRDVAASRFISQAQLYVLFLFTYLLFLNGDIEIKAYFDALYLAGIGMALLAVYCYGWSGLIRGLNEGERLGRKITNENVFGMVFSKAALVAFYYFIHSKGHRLSITHMVFVVIFTFFAFSSGSKKACLMIIAGIIGVTVLEYGIQKALKAVVVIALAIIGVIIILRLPIFSTMRQRISGFLTGNKDSSDLVRSKMIALSMQFFYEKPILGHGFNNFGALSGMGSYSHNNMTELLVSTGIVGFIVFYIPYLYIIIWGWKRGVVGKEYTAILLLVLAIIYLVFGYGMVEYYDKEYWLFLGVMIACIDHGFGVWEGERIHA